MVRSEDCIRKKIGELEEERKLAKDAPSIDRLEYGKYLLNWVLRKKGCSDD